MAMLKTLQEYHDEIKYITLGVSGYTIGIPNDFNANDFVRIQGYGKPSEEDINFIKDNNLPAVDLRTIPEDILRMGGSRLLPLIGQSNSDGPISGMSYKTFEVYANIANKIGAGMYGVKKINLIPEMFKKLTKPEKEHLAQINSVAKKTTFSLTDYLKLSKAGELVSQIDWEPLDNTETKSFFNFSTKILNKQISEYSAKKVTLDNECKELRSKKVSMEEYLVTFTEKLGFENALKDLSKVKDLITWNSHMVTANNYSEKEGWDAIRYDMNNLKGEIENRLQKNSKDTHAQLHKSAELTYPIIAKVVNMANKIGDLTLDANIAASF